LNTINKAKKVPQNKVFYFGIPMHSNLGDLAQGVCIRKWIANNYPDRYCVEVETDAIVNTSFSIINSIKKLYSKDDIIVFQSGYTTTDLGGFADAMHQEVIKAFPDAKILMFPQTIYFAKKENKEKCSRIYNSAKNMLYLARDEVSYKEAIEMFPNIRVRLFPDIVTTRIGVQHYTNERNGFLFCCRNDGEKFYSDDQIHYLINQCKNISSVQITDTTKNLKSSEIVKNADSYISNEIESYSHYKLIITDRYHGTIFSLAAGTPVIVLKTTDHKVITGADWFKDVYAGHIYVAKDLNDALCKAKELMCADVSHVLKPYFKEKYYDTLKQLFEER
jgi:exopolysaccharide biosynthesis predicted pyruvyltransferase EpsI